MQVKQKETFIQSFGGLNFIHNYLKANNFSELALNHLGSRNLTAQYSYGELLRQLFFIAAIGGDTLDESNYLKYQLQDHPDLKIASPDTIEYAFQELRQQTRQVTSASGAVHQINEHSSFNKLLVTLCSNLLLSAGGSYMMDYDGHTLENTKVDNAFTYKQTEGYYPVVCSINKMPVYMQNRNGNTPESYGQKDVIETAINNCKEKNISINAFRADACCYEKSTIEYLEFLGITFYIRAENCRSLMDALTDEPDWQPGMLGNKKVEVCSIEERIFGEKKYRRIVAYRYKKKGQLSIDDTNGYRYYAIVTSDTEASPLECINIYNQRGCDGEHHFEELDHDFNWNKLPFDNIEMNTIYMYGMLVAYLLFNAVKIAFAKGINFIDKTMRIKNFILHFVTLPAKWIKTGRRWILNIYTTKDYSALWSS
ncbi:MAG TPA: IS1380 family transposase [Hanamia sp.]|jgi:hypothetical protein